MYVRKCQKCGKCCRSNMGPFILPSDIENICEFIKFSSADFLLKMCREHSINIEGKKVIIFTLKMQNGKCIFLNNNNLCNIYEHRPYQCMKAPYNFLAQYTFWSHMRCVKEKDFIDIDSSSQDKKIFLQVINEEYEKYLARR